MKSSEEQHQYKQYVVEDIPNSEIQIEKRDNGNPIVKLLLPGNQTPKIVDFDKDGVFARNATTPSSGGIFARVGAAGGLIGGLSQAIRLFTEFI